MAYKDKQTQKEFILKSISPEDHVNRDNLLESIKKVVSEECYITKEPIVESNITEALRKKKGRKEEYDSERYTVAMALTLEGAKKDVIDHCERTIERTENNPDMDMYYKIDKVEYYRGVIRLLRQKLRNYSEEDFIVGHAVYIYGISIECVRLI